MPLYYKDLYIWLACGSCWFTVITAGILEDTCNGELPYEYRNVNQSDLPSPFNIKIFSTRYFAGVAQRVVISSVTEIDTPLLTGLRLWAVSEKDTTIQAGRFYFYDTVTTYVYEGLTCLNRNIFHDDSYGFSMLRSKNYNQRLQLPFTFHWMSHYYVGWVKFEASFFAYDQTNGYHYWLRENSTTLQSSEDIFPCEWPKRDCGDNICETSKIYCPRNCTHGMFNCQGRSCLPQGQVCDGKIDCIFRSDDENWKLCGYECELLTEERCPYSKKCISSSLFCDQRNDCGNWEDEYNCNNVCGGVFTNTSGTIYAPLEAITTDKYKLQARCWWMIEAPEGHIIRIIFKDVYLEARCCDCDYIQVFDGNKSDNLLLKICADTMYKEVFSTGNRMLVDFFTDLNINKKAWHADYTRISTNSNVTCRDPALCKDGKCQVQNYKLECRCNVGFIPRTFLHNDCIDYDECGSFLDTCTNGVCVNMAGTYMCECKDGYHTSTNGRQCLQDCATYKKMCPDFTCIHKYGLCPGERCPIGYLTCDDRTLCLPPRLKCDGTKQCSDDTDEVYCITSSDCNTHQVACNDGSACVDYYKLCDNSVDCVDKTDEFPYHCNGQCKPYEFECSTSQLCIPRGLVCDGVTDCPRYGEDEFSRNCGEKGITTGAPSTNTGSIIGTVVTVIFAVVTICIISAIVTVRKRRQLLANRRRRSVVIPPVNITNNPPTTGTPSGGSQQHLYSAGTYQPGQYTSRPSPRISNSHQSPTDIPPVTLPPAYSDVFFSPVYQTPQDNTNMDDPPPPSYESLPDELKQPPPEIYINSTPPVRATVTPPDILDHEMIGLQDSQSREHNSPRLSQREHNSPRRSPRHSPEIARTNEHQNRMSQASYV